MIHSWHIEANNAKGVKNMSPNEESPNIYLGQSLIHLVLNFIICKMGSFGPWNEKRNASILSECCYNGNEKPELVKWTLARLTTKPYC